MRTTGPSNSQTAKVTWEKVQIIEKTSEGKTSEKEISLDILDSAASSQKPIMIFITASKGSLSHSCTSMENYVFGSPGVVATAAKFHAAKLDLSETDKNLMKKFLSKYKINNIPSVLFLAYNGKRLYVLSGECSPGKALGIMEEVLAANGKILKKANSKKASS